MKTPSSNTTKRANDRKTIWVFTPSRTDPKDLEFILVQRQKLLQDAVERVRESALTDHKHHLLFVGPRGCGKTHLVTLIVSRLSADDKLTDRLRIAWLNEDETCTTLLELLFKIHSALEKRYPDEYRADRLAAAYDLKPDAALEFVSKHLLACLGSRTLLVVAENLDAIFDGLGDAGQKQLRAFIQENPKLSIVATSQRLVEDFSSRTSPFFGFFQTEHLKPLNVEEATELLQNIARLQEKADVVEFLATSRGRSRVRALHHLSGGNHRIYIVLSQFITRDSIDALLGPFMKMVDELTPYYQERIRWLPPLQRKIVEYLCGCEGTVPVKEIAKRLFATPQTISSQLQDLREKGYVEANQRGRESLYEITEPLMRICVEVKENQRHQPLRLLVDFLRVWYDDQELKLRLGKMAPASAVREYLESAIQRNAAEGNLRKQIFLEDLQLSLSEKMNPAERERLLRNCVNLPETGLLAVDSWVEGNKAEAFAGFDDAIAQESTSSGKADLLICRAQLHLASGEHQNALEDYTAVIGLSGAPVEPVAQAIFYRGVAHNKAGETQRAIEDYTAVIGLSGAPVEQVARALLNRGVTYGRAGVTQRAIKDFTAVIELSGVPVEQVAKALLNRGVAHALAGVTQRAIDDYTAVIGLSGAPVEQVAKALLNRGVAHGQAGETQREIEDYTAVIGLSGAPVEQVAKALLNRGIIHRQTGETQHAIDDYTAVIGLSGAPAEQVARALLNRGIIHRQTGETQHAIDDYTAVIGLSGAPAEQVAKALFNRGVAHGQAGETQREIDDYTAVIGLSGAPAEQVAKALFNRGIAYGQAGEMQRAINDFTAVIGLSDAPIEQVAQALLNRGVAHARAGETQRAIEDYTAVIGLSGAPVEPVARALINRGITHGQAGETQRAIEDYTAVIGLSGAPVEPVARALVNRGITHGQAGEMQRAINDYTAVIGLSGAPVEQAAKALFNRGIAHGQAGETQREIEDYTAVIGLSGAPVEQVAKALLNRGVAHGQAGETQREIEDYTAVIGLSGAPVEQVAKAFYSRGVTFLQKSRKQESQSDFEALIHLPAAPSEEVMDSYLALSELHFSEGKWSDGFQALEAGLACGSKAQPPHHVTVTGLIGVLFSAGLSPEGRRGKVADLLQICSKHEALPVLGEAVVQHIGSVFRSGEPFPSADNLEGWASAWEQAAESVGDFRLSVRLLRTGIDFVKAAGKDPGILLDLTFTERAILEQALGLARKEQAKSM